MAHSLDPSCTPLKHKYDACFNAWFEGYLQPLEQGLSQAERERKTKEKAEEYDKSCGKVWEAYKNCVAAAVDEKGLTGLLEQARDENPLLEPEPEQR